MSTAAVSAILLHGQESRDDRSSPAPYSPFRCITRLHLVHEMEERPETRVLIVDDRPAFRRQLRRLLTRAGLSVVGEAGDIPEAEAQVQVLQPDLAVVDVMMPGVNGIEGTPRLRALAPGMRVILVSAYRDRSGVYQAAATAVGAEAFIAKDDLDLEMVQEWSRE